MDFANIDILSEEETFNLYDDIIEISSTCWDCGCSYRAGSWDNYYICTVGNNCQSSGYFDYCFAVLDVNNKCSRKGLTTWGCGTCGSSIAYRRQNC